MPIITLITNHAVRYETFHFMHDEEIYETCPAPIVSNYTQICQNVMTFEHVYSPER